MCHISVGNKRTQGAVFLHIDFFNLKEFHIEKIKNETLGKTHFFFSHYRLNWLLFVVFGGGGQGQGRGVVVV